jgi:hypothetical protein
MLLVLVDYVSNEPYDPYTAEVGPWLLDSIHRLCAAQNRWTAPDDPEIIPLIRMGLSLAMHNRSVMGPHALMYRKACVCLTFLLPQLGNRSSEVVGNQQAAEQARATLCSAMLALTRASIDLRPISRLVAAQVVPSCDGLALAAPELGSGSDFSVS